MSRIGINQVGYIPFVGCFIGVTRIVWGIFQMIAALSVMPFDFDWGRRYSICALHSWGRGGLELIPFGGGIVLYSYDYR
ncbi:MAG: hypothetical protein VX777_01740 [Chlamydiota bacterium]|nr:hypothetical protein [Chlamydiota bacterium]